MSISEKFLPVILVCSAFLISCGGGSSGSDDANDMDGDDDGIDTATQGNFDATRSLFSLDLTNDNRVSCTLENGSTTTCYELTFTANGAGDTEGTGTIGPFCPETIFDLRSETGVGVYDGDTNPGFQSLVDAVQNMDDDGYEIVDDAGNVNQIGGGNGNSACLEMQIDTTLSITYLIPLTPELRDEPYDIATIESIGFGLTGVPYKGHPPGVAIAEAGIGGAGSGSIPALDLCGGHVDPFGYYHWHFVPQSINTVLESNVFNFTDDFDMTCSNSNIAYDAPSAFAGLAKDGFPIYGAYDSISGADTAPDITATVDECNGHNHATDEFPDGVYHYHALADGAPNVPECLVGSFVERNDFSVQ